MYKSTEETMAKQKSHDWRVQQQNFFKNQIVKDVEFVQDQRIFDFFNEQPVLGIGDIDYFKSKLQIVKKKEKVSQCLIILNKKILDLDLITLLEKIKDVKKVCVSINKFLLYTNFYNQDTVEDYDEAIFLLIKNIFKERDVKYFFVKNLQGSHFNFASPTTQFFIT